jgi:hypothetical protein
VTRLTAAKCATTARQSRTWRRWSSTISAERSADAAALSREERDATLAEELLEVANKLAGGVREHVEALSGALLEEDNGGAYGDELHDEECVGTGDDSTCSKQRRLEGARGGGVARTRRGPYEAAWLALHRKDTDVHHGYL